MGLFVLISCWFESVRRIGWTRKEGCYEIWICTISFAIPRYLICQKWSHCEKLSHQNHRALREMWLGTEHSKYFHSHTHKDGSLIKTLAQLHITITMALYLEKDLKFACRSEHWKSCRRWVIMKWERGLSGIGRKLVTPDVNRRGSSHTPWTEVAVRYWRCVHAYILCIPTLLCSFLCSLCISCGWNCA